MNLDYKTACGTLAAIIGSACFVPYIRDIYRKTTTPHVYTWLIWTILQGTVVIAMFNNHAGFGVLSLATGTVLCAFTCILSIKNGTKNITTFDTICLIGALASICVYIFLKDTLLSIILMSVIDFVGFLPTLRKMYIEPHSETLAMYALFAFSGTFTLLALSEYSLITILYPATLMLINIIATLVIYMRRKQPTLPSQREG